ncbi:unnamed protein product [Durusdinium trenchii]|uniref:Uncharacterized protein n=1 Tax=Durusdinium trenchii TaxID=1381693 RepID=A0ABP0JC63_9DINO
MITELRGDLAWHKAVWQFEERGWQSADVCFFCQAQSKGHVCPYTMLGPEADWAQTEFKDPWLWAGEVLPNRLCPWLGLPGFSIDTVRMCTMHNVNLGLMQTANGSSLINLIQNGLYGDPTDPMDQNLKRLFADFDAWSKENKAYTGRVLCAYSAEVSKLAAEKRLDVVGPRRIFGKWLKDQVQNGGLQSYLNDPKLPLQSACMPDVHKYAQQTASFNELWIIDVDAPMKECKLKLELMDWDSDLIYASKTLALEPLVTAAYWAKVLKRPEPGEVDHQAWTPPSSEHFMEPKGRVDLKELMVRPVMAWSPRRGALVDWGVFESVLRPHKAMRIMLGPRNLKALDMEGISRRAMASFMFLTFINNMKPGYESRVDTTWEGPKLKKVWADMEHKCWETYLDEANDDSQGVHPYQKLKKEASQCKVLIKEDTRREILQDCTQRIVDFAKECAAGRRKAMSSVPASGSSSRD